MLPQVTEAQLQGAGAVGGSRYAFGSSSSIRGSLGAPGAQSALPAPPASTPGTGLLGGSAVLGGGAGGGYSVAPRYSSSYGGAPAISTTLGIMGPGGGGGGSAAAKGGYTPATPSHLPTSGFSSSMGRDYAAATPYGRS